MLLRIFARLRGGVRIARRVGWVERSDTHQVPPRQDDGFRKNSTHPTGFGLSSDMYDNTQLDGDRLAPLMSFASNESKGPRE
jgi:hypothetical protein